MLTFFSYLALLVVLIACWQFYACAVSRPGVSRQQRCQPLGIVFCTLGIVALVFRTLPFVIGGLVLLMVGLRLIAHGLDRIDKKTYIDRYEEDQ